MDIALFCGLPKPNFCIRLVIGCAHLVLGRWVASIGGDFDLLQSRRRLLSQGGDLAAQHHEENQRHATFHNSILRHADAEARCGLTGTFSNGNGGVTVEPIKPCLRSLLSAYRPSNLVTRNPPNSLVVNESLWDSQRDVTMLLGNWQGKRHGDANICSTMAFVSPDEISAASARTSAIPVAAGSLGFP